MMKNVAYKLLSLAVMAFLFIAMIKVPLAAASTSWLSGWWLYRVPITITAGSNGMPANYQIKITVNTASLISAGKMRYDGCDIRFTKADGTTPLNYFIDSGINTSTTTIFVKDPDSLGANASHIIYMYYGSPNATSQSNGGAVFEFFESFEPGYSGWTYSEYDTYGQLSGGTATDWFTDGSQSYRFYGYGTNRGDWAQLSKTFDFTSVGRLHIDWRVHGAYQSGTGETTVFRIKLTDNVLWSLGTYQDYTYSQDFDVVSFTGNYALTFYMWRVGQTYEAFWFDKIYGRKYVSPEPTVSFGSEEVSKPSTTEVLIENFEDVSDWFYSASPPSHGSVSGSQATEWKTEGSYSYKLYAAVSQIYLETATAYLTSKSRFLFNHSQLKVNVKGMIDSLLSQNYSFPGSFGVQISADNTNWITLKSYSRSNGSYTVVDNWVVDVPYRGSYYIRFFAQQYGPNSTTFYFDNLCLSFISRPPTAASLLTENQTNPTKLLVFVPKFSAVGNDNDNDQMKYYALQVSTDPTFSTITHWNQPKTAIATFSSGSRCANITYGGAPLSRGITYYWRIKFWDEIDEEGLWSDPATFKINQLPTAATSLTLNGPKVGQTLTATASGASDPDGDTITYYYRFYNQTDGVEVKAYSTSSSYTVVVSDAHDNIRVFVKAWDGYEFGPEIENSKIIANTVSSVTSLLTQGQTNPTRLTTFSPTFSWAYTDADNDAQTKYQVYVGTASGGYDMWNSGQVTSSSTSVVYAGSPLSRGVTYYVQVRIYDGYDWSDWKTGTFRINQLPTALNPLAEGLINPTRLTTFTPALSWTFADPDGDSQTKYQIQVGTSEGGNDKWDVTVNASSASAVYAGSSLSRGVTYYWRVRVFDNYEWSDWSAGLFRLNQTASVSNAAAGTLSEVYLYNYGNQNVQVDRLFVQGVEVSDFVIKDAETGAEYDCIPAGKLVKIAFPSPSESEFYLTVITKYKGVYSWRVVL